MTTLQALEQIECQLASPPVPKANKAWGGADVVIALRSKPLGRSDSFYPEPRSVVSPHALELSWLFEGLRDAFHAENRIDSQMKIEFFGRLANAANRCLRKSPSPAAQVLCAAVLHEAFAIYEEMEEGRFGSFAVAVGNEIADDYVDEALRTGFIGVENTREFFAERGIDLETT